MRFICSKQTTHNVGEISRRQKTFYSHSKILWHVIFPIPISQFSKTWFTISRDDLCRDEIVILAASLWENIRHSLTEQTVLLLFQIYKIFLLKRLVRKISFLSTLAVICIFITDEQSFCAIRGSVECWHIDCHNSIFQIHF